MSMEAYSYIGYAFGTSIFIFTATVCYAIYKMVTEPPRPMEDRSHLHRRTQ